MGKNLRIGINARIFQGSGTSSLETVLRVLTTIGKLPDGDEEYVFIVPQGDSEWLKSFLGGRQRVVRFPEPVTGTGERFITAKKILKPLVPTIRAVKQKIFPPPPAPPPPKYVMQVSNGFYESLGCDVIHFPDQEYTYCRLPTVYNPHDLQHLHFPQFFTPDVLEKRALLYPSACRAAAAVVAGSQFIKQDLIDRLGIDAEKIQVIPWSAPEIVARDFSAAKTAAVLSKYDCPPRPFMLYPAMTWEHKNHLRLLEAVARLRDRDGVRVNLVCTGYKHAFFSHIEQLLTRLQLNNQVKFTGVVSIEELNVLYKSAEFVIIPTLFEAASGPLFEAWQHDVAAACSAVTSLPEQAADAALLFDPFSVDAIADAIKKMFLDQSLRDELRRRGQRRLADFDIDRTARAYRAIYRKTAGLKLSDEDRLLLNWDWMRDSTGPKKSDL